MNFRSMLGLDGFVDRWMGEKVSGTDVLYSLGLVAGLILTGYAYLERSETRRKWQRAERFSQQVSDYQFLQSNQKQTSKESETIESPLSYLENQVDQDNLGGLSPLGQENGNRQYRLSLEGISAKEAFELMRTFDLQQGLKIDKFTIERISLDSETFDARFELFETEG